MMRGSAFADDRIGRHDTPFGQRDILGRFIGSLVHWREALTSFHGLYSVINAVVQLLHELKTKKNFGFPRWSQMKRTTIATSCIKYSFRLWQFGQDILELLPTY
jgi:hypothetical protein